MSQKDDSESDIWEYKPLKKKKKPPEPSLSCSGPVAKRRCASKNSVKTDTSTPAKQAGGGRDTCRKAVQTNDLNNAFVNVSAQCKEEHSRPGTQTLSSQPTHSDEVFTTDDAEEERPSSGDFCPICQMPFSILLVQSQRWHVAECLDTSRDESKECPDGLQCSSTIPSHYKRYSHTLLAHSRATDKFLLCPSEERGSGGETSLGCFPGPLTTDLAGSISESSQDSAVNLSALSGHSDLPSERCGTTPTKPTNALLLLRSPGPEDVKKKKGWSPSVKSLKSASASQDSKPDVSSTPLKVDSGGQAFEGGVVKAELCPYDDNEISYSPLSEFPTEFEVNEGKPRKALFPSSAFGNESEDSVALFSDAFSSEDELFDEHCETKNGLIRYCSSALSNTQVESITSLVPGSQLAPSTAAENTPSSASEKEGHGKATNTVVNTSKPSLQSAQSIVLEDLRETLSSSNNLHSKSLNENSVPTEGTSTLYQVSSSQASVTQTSPTMVPRKSQSKASQASGLKQLDIGVFFGLKPLKEKEKEAESGPSEQNTQPQGSTPGESTRKRGEWRGGRQWKRWGGDTTTETSANQGTVGDGNTTNAAQGDRGRGGRGGRRRWNRGRMDGEPDIPKRCPFYKKIPGTKFAVDAFSYGEVEGISAYFLTHFHSDHYGGLKKSSTFPIYCNRITGNLVKSKLKVAEEYVHILPMNTPVTVEGVGVTLLDANHCPGAAMLLLFLPYGQTVLHTGDFRADPSMETYPALQSCRVQTLYLDTTYCSPEYTFPTQQEVISFAANTAFELVTLNPRTLMVCGSYSVGKEKVFLAMAEVLGSKVCLSRDKYNTMCSLESERIRRLITTDLKAAQVHVLPMMQLNFKNLQAYLSKVSGQYDQLVAFKPTGWTFSQQLEAVEDIQPQTSGNITIYGIPYSEHSSFLEMKRFVQWLRPLKIIPTVNVGSWASRKAMERCFSEWLKEANAIPKP